MKKNYVTQRIKTHYAVLFGSICFASCTPPQNDEAISNKFEKKLISHKEGTLLFDEYSKTNNEILTKSRNGEPDSRWYWLSLEDWEGYFQYVKKNAKEQKLENLGIRIYLGKYPIDYPKDKMAKPEYAGYQTIFIVPTTKPSQTDQIKSLTSATSVDGNADVKSISAMNMVNPAPPPKITQEMD